MYNMNYTQHNWTVSSNTTDTLLTPKNISVPDLSYSKDYKKSMDEPQEAVITNTTGDTIVSAETVRFGCSPVKNIYTGTKVDITEMHTQKSGVQVMVELNETYTGTNTVSGQEIALPCKGRIVLRFPTASCVTDAMIADLLVRTIASAYGTGSTNASRIVQIARGALLPDGL